MFSARYCDNRSEIPDVGDDAVNSDVTFTLVKPVAPAIGAAPTLTVLVASVSALATQQVVLRNAL